MSLEKPLAGSNPMLHFQIRAPSTGVRPPTTLFHGLLVFTWLRENTKGPSSGCDYRSTRAIASGTNLSEARVHEICGIHPRIHLSTGKEPDKWRLK